MFHLIIKVIKEIVRDAKNAAWGFQYIEILPCPYRSVFLGLCLWPNGNMFGAGFVT